MDRAVTGSCHCGAVGLTLARAPMEVTECRCSICRRYGALWAYFPVGEVTLDGPTEVYVWGRRRIGFHRCGACGSVLVWRSMDPSYGECGVNARMLDGFDPDAVTLIVEDDASVD